MAIPALKRALSRWRPVDAAPARFQTAVSINLGLALLAIAGFALLQPPADWSDPVLIGALCAVSAIAYLAEARLRFGVLAFYGATFVPAFVTLVAAGALPALLVWVIPDVISRYILRREPRLSPGLVATVSSYALALLLGAELVALAGEPTGAASAPALYAAGVAVWVVNFAVARLAFAPFYQDIRPRTLIQDELGALAPTALGMLVVGVVAGLAVVALGVPALILLTLVICVPQLVLDRLVSSAPAAELEPVAAARLYADAIADVLQMPRDQRRELSCAAGMVEFAEEHPDRGLAWRDADLSRAAFIALHANERWIGNGWPAGLPAEAIPLGSRVLAVASEWARLTARGTPEMCQAEAVLALEAQSGRAFDPSVVDAAAQVIADEAGFAIEPAFQPKLHRIPGPRSWRRGSLPDLLPRATAAG